MAKNCKQEECPPEGAPAWMVTYGDMMTLLLTFFVLIVSFSSIEQVKFKAAISSIQEGLGIWPDNSGILTKIMLSDQTKESQDASELIEEVAEMIKEQQLFDMVEVYNTPAGVRLIITDPGLFQSGMADISTDFQRLLSGLSVIIRNKNFDEIRVEGHTDNMPINTPLFPTNWELSGARALNVVKYLAFQEGFDPAHLSAVGYGEYRPRADNTTVEGRGKNRRVEIYLEHRKGEFQLFEY
jgi:chemotaxis protein MotB